MGVEDIISATITMPLRFSPMANGQNRRAITIITTMANTTQIGTEVRSSTTPSGTMMQETPHNHDHTPMQKVCLKALHRPETVIITQRLPLRPLNKRAGIVQVKPLAVANRPTAQVVAAIMPMLSAITSWVRPSERALLERSNWAHMFSQEKRYVKF